MVTNFQKKKYIYSFIFLFLNFLAKETDDKRNLPKTPQTKQFIIFSLSYIFNGNQSEIGNYSLNPLLGIPVKPKEQKT
jgi:hypothetical protein